MEEKKVSKRDIYGGIDDWEELIGFVKNNIMQLPYECKIPQQLILRLDGLSKGEYISNNKFEPMARYQYKDILMAFKAAEYTMKGKDFASSEHRFNYSVKIVESKINDIVKLRLSKEKVVEKVQNVDTRNFVHDKAEYISKAEQIKTNDVLEGLW